MTEKLATNSGPIDTSGEPAPPPFDRKLALDRVDGDASLLADLAQIFLDECPRMLGAIQEAVQRRDAAAIERAAHSLKGSVSTFAAKDAVDAALKLEIIGRDARIEVAETAAASALHEVARLRTALQELIAGQQHASEVKSR